MDNFNYRRFGEQIDFVRLWIRDRKLMSLTVACIGLLLLMDVIQQFQLHHQQIQLSNLRGQLSHLKGISSDLAKIVRDVHSFHKNQSEVDRKITMKHVEFSNKLSDRIIQNSNEISNLKTELKPKIYENKNFANNLSARIIQNSNEISILKTELKPKIDEHEEEIKELDEFLEKNNEKSDYYENSSIALKSCAEWRRHGKTKSGYYKIDVDGPQSGVEAMVVFCKFYFLPQLDETVVKSNEMFEMPSLVQIEALIQYSHSCSQMIDAKRGKADSMITPAMCPVYWKDRHGAYVHCSKL